MYFFHYSFFNLLNMLQYSKNEVIIQWTTHNNTEKESTYSWHCFDLRKSTKGKLHFERWWKTVINDDLDFVADEMTRYLSSDTTIPFDNHNQRKYMNFYEIFCKWNCLLDWLILSKYKIWYLLDNIIHTRKLIYVTHETSNTSKKINQLKIKNLSYNAYLENSFSCAKIFFPLSFWA